MRGGKKARSYHQFNPEELLSELCTCNLRNALDCPTVRKKSYHDKPTYESWEEICMGISLWMTNPSKLQIMKSWVSTWLWDKGRTLQKMVVIRVLLLPILHNRDSSQFVLDDNCLKVIHFFHYLVKWKEKQENVSPKTHVEDLTSPFSITVFFVLC